MSPEDEPISDDEVQLGLEKKEPDPNATKEILEPDLEPFKKKIEAIETLEELREILKEEGHELVADYMGEVKKELHNEKSKYTLKNILELENEDLFKTTFNIFGNKNLNNVLREKVIKLLQREAESIVEKKDEK